MINFIFIPEFVATSLSRKGIELATILDFAKLRQSLSINDIAITAELQKHLDKLLPSIPGKETYYGFENSLVDTWYQNADAETQVYINEVFSKVLVDSGQAKQETIDRLFNKDYQSEEASKETPYDLVDLGRKYYGIIVKPGIFPDPYQSKQLIRSLVKASYVYETQDVIAQSSLFRQYVETTVNK